MGGSWSIDVGQSVGVIRGAAAKIESVEPALQGMMDALLAAQAAIPGGVVVEALAEVAGQSLRPDIDAVLSRSGAIFDSTAKALSYYQAGDLEMAAVAQRSAARAGGSSGHQRPLID